MENHNHTIHIQRKDVRVCIECGEVLGVEEATFPIEDRRYRDIFAIEILTSILDKDSYNNDDMSMSKCKYAYKYADMMLEARKIKE
jgi:hypothetical protein